MEKKRTTQHKWMTKVIYIFATFVMVLGNFASVIPATVSAASSDGTITGLTVDKSTVDAGSDVTATVTADLNNAGGLFGIGARSYNATISLSGTGLTFDATKTNKSGVVVSSDGKSVAITGQKNSDFDTFSATLYIKTTLSYTDNVNATVTASIDGTSNTKTANITVNKLTPTFTAGKYPSDHSGNGMSVLTDPSKTPWTVGQPTLIDLQDTTSLAAGGSIILSFPQNNLKIDADKTLKLQGRTSDQLSITTASNGSVTIKNTSSSAISLASSSAFILYFDLTSAPSSGVIVDVTRSDGDSTNYATLTVPGTSNPLGAVVAPSSVTFQMRSVVKDIDNTDTKDNLNTYLYAMAGQYLFSVQKTDASGKWYSIIDNGNGNRDWTNIYKSIVASGTNWGTSAKITQSNFTPYFVPFRQIDSSGAVVSANMPFQQGETYTLTPYIPVAGAPTTFARQTPGSLSQVYYMPDGIPTFSIVNGTDIALDTTNANGRAVPGQWKLNSAGIGIVADTYKVKRVKIVDQDGKAISGAKVNFTDMTVTTGSDGTGEIVPKTWVNGSTTGAFAGFYWGKGTGDGTQAFKDISFTGSNANNYYLPNSNFSLKLDTSKDLLSLSDPSVGSIIDAKDAVYNKRHEQTVVIKVMDKSKLTDAQKNFSIKKTDTTSGDALSGAKFAVTDTSTSGATATTSDATGSDGITNVTAAGTSTAAKTVKVQETTAPEGYKLNKTIYYGKWTLGKGFTAVGTDTNPTATKSSDGLVSVDSDGHLVFTDRQLSKAETTLSIKKVDQNGAALAGSTFYVTEPTADKATDPLAATTTAATGNDGLTSVALPDGSKTATRIVKVQETRSKNGYQIDGHTYYAKWEQGSGFTAVTAGDAAGSVPSDSTNPTATSAANATIDADGNLVIKNNPTTSYTGDNGYRWRYVNAAGTGINGAALPATPGSIIQDASGETYDGLSGLILNPTSNSGDYMDAGSVDYSIPGNMTYGGDDSMHTSTQVSGDLNAAAGYGIIQPLGTTGPLPISASSGDLYEQVINAVTKGYLMQNAGLAGYSLLNNAMKTRAAAGTDAHDYYVNNSTIYPYAPTNGGSIAATTTGSGNGTFTNAVTTKDKTVSVILNKVKQLKLQDSNGDALSGYTVYFKNAAGKDVLKATTTSTGLGEITPTDDKVFAWPEQTSSSSLTLDKIEDADGNTVANPTATGGELKLDATKDTLSFANQVAGTADISSDGQTVQYTVKAKPTIKMHVVNENGFGVAGSTNLAGSEFKITRTDTGDVYTATSDANGDINVDLGSTSAGTMAFKIQQTKATSGYSSILGTVDFQWSKDAGVTTVGLFAAPKLSIGTGGAFKVQTDGSLTIMLSQRIIIRQSAMFNLAKRIATRSGADYTLQEYKGTSATGASFTTGSYAAPKANTAFFEATVHNTQDPATVRTFKVTVKNALEGSTIKPYIPLSAGTSYFLRWSGAQGVIGVSKTVDGTYTTMTADHVASVMATDAETDDTPEQNVFNLGFDQNYTLNTTALGASGTAVAVNGASVLLNNGSNNYTTPASADGKITLSGTQIYQKLEGGAVGTMPTSANTLNLKLFAQGTDTSSSSGSYPYNSIDTHNVTFQYGKGFSVANADSQVAAAEGNLNLRFRRYVLRAQDLTDATTSVDATFNFAVTDDAGKTVTRTLETGDSGTVQLPDPLAMFGSNSTITALGVTADRKYTATLTQTDGDEAYGPVLTPITLTYTSATGYQATNGTIGDVSAVTTDYTTQAPTTLAQTPTGRPYIWRNTDSNVTTQEVDTFMRNGSGVGTQILYNLEPQVSDVSFVNVADGNNLNFGKHDVSGETQTFGVEKTGSENLAGAVPTTAFDTSKVTFWPTIGDSSAGDQAFGFQVKQTGSVPSGWSIDMTAGNLQVGSQADVSTAGSALSLKNGRMEVYRTAKGTTSFNPIGTATGADHEITLGASADDDSVVMRSIDSVTPQEPSTNVPGIYSAYWNTKDINLIVPAYGGTSNGVYSALLTWTRVLGTTTQQ